MKKFGNHCITYFNISKYIKNMLKKNHKNRVRFLARKIVRTYYSKNKKKHVSLLSQVAHRDTRNILNYQETYKRVTDTKNLYFTEF